MFARANQSMAMRIATEQKGINNQLDSDCCHFFSLVV
jgi:hypothetical protein